MKCIENKLEVLEGMTFVMEKEDIETIGNFVEYLKFISDRLTDSFSSEAKIKNFVYQDRSIKIVLEEPQAE